MTEDFNPYEAPEATIVEPGDTPQVPLIVLFICISCWSVGILGTGVDIYLIQGLLDDRRLIRVMAILILALSAGMFMVAGNSFLEDRVRRGSTLLGMAIVGVGCLSGWYLNVPM